MSYVTLKDKPHAALLGADVVIFGVFFAVLRWFIPHGGHWSGSILVLGFLIIALVFTHSQIVRRRSQKTDLNGDFSDGR